MENRRRRRGRMERLLGKAFLICILLIIIINIFVPDGEKSEEENRMLSQRPRLTVSSLLSGDFMEQFETYQSDQFAGRNFWRSIKVTLNRLGGSREENGVFLGKNGQLLQDVVVPDQEQLQKNLAAIRDFAGQNEDVPVTMLLVPDAASVLSGSLPSLATVADQTSSISQVKKTLGDSVQWVDAVKAMNSHADEKIYYKTDHHWTALGAFYTFQEAAGTLEITGDYTSAYASYPITADFNGTLASMSGCELKVKEQMEIYVPKNVDNDVVVTYVDEQKKRTSLYDSSKLYTRDKYAVYLGGNFSLVDIRTMAENQRKLLIVKDSYANSFVPFLTPYFSEIVLLDPRYYTGTIQDTMETYQVTDVLFLYSGNTFFQDNHISGVLTGE